MQIKPFKNHTQGSFRNLAFDFAVFYFHNYLILLICRVEMRWVMVYEPQYDFYPKKL